jgi:hypothetical protein
LLPQIFLCEAIPLLLQRIMEAERATHRDEGR